MVMKYGPEMSVRNYHFSLCNNPEERRSRTNFIALKNISIFSKEI